jgi:hypothetical protein
MRFIPLFTDSKTLASRFRGNKEDRREAFTGKSLLKQTVSSRARERDSKPPVRARLVQLTVNGERTFH